MLEGDYSSDSDDEQPSAAPHVDREQVVGAINDLLGADYSEKYHLSTFIKYNLEKYTPLKSRIACQTDEDDDHAALSGFIGFDS
jgi:hypothetical protein